MQYIYNMLQNVHTSEINSSALKSGDPGGYFPGFKGQSKDQEKNPYNGLEYCRIVN